MTERDYAKCSERWFPVHWENVRSSTVRESLLSPARHNVVAAGRRALKTELRKRKLVTGTANHAGLLTMRGGRFFYAAPTFDQARRIAWDDLKAMTAPFWTRRPSEDRLVIYAGDGAELHVLGMDKPSRIEGVIWHGGVMDEYADMKSNVWSEHVQPVTADSGAWIDFIGVPEGLDHFYAIAEYARTASDPDWSFYTWKSSAVVDPERVEAARRQLDDRSFRQEYEAEFLSAGRAAYYAFSGENLDRRPFDPSAETWLSWDFNATEKPMSVIVIQRNADRPGTYHIPTAFVTPYTQTETMAERVSDYLDERQFVGALRIRGDYAGNAVRSTATLSDYNILERHFRNRNDFDLRSRPTRKIRDRITAANALLKNAAGEVRVTIHPEDARALVEDLERVEWKSNEYELDDRDPKRTHPSDAFSYFAYTEHPTDVKDVTVSVR